MPTIDRGEAQQQNRERQIALISKNSEFHDFAAVDGINIIRRDPSNDNPPTITIAPGKRLTFMESAMIKPLSDRYGLLVPRTEIAQQVYRCSGFAELAAVRVTLLTAKRKITHPNLLAGYRYMTGLGIKECTLPPAELRILFLLWSSQRQRVRGLSTFELADELYLSTDEAAQLETRINVCQLRLSLKKAGSRLDISHAPYQIRGMQ